MKRVFVGVASLAVILAASLSLNSGSQPPSSQSSNIDSTQTNPRASQKAKPVSNPTCDGSAVTTNCVVGGVRYIKYVYHPAVPAKTHTETATTYQEEVTGYCTLCNDGTYSPSCATGRGACSYHGGVAQWNAPRYSSTPEYSTKTIIDVPAQKAYYEKVTR